jgi:TonB family protein
MSIGDQEILLSDSLGPAVLGFLAPRIILPRWLAEKETALRSLVLSHEREHIVAKDHVTLFAALLLVALMPWNIALWWQLRRLRAAMEIDCDSRVLRDGVDAHDYSQALLTVGQQSLRTPFASVALTEPVSDLEKRIGIMLDKARNFSIAGFGARSAVAVTVLSIAIAVNAPNAQQTTDGDEASDSGKAIPTVRTAIFDRLSEAQACMEAEDTTCAMGILDEVAQRRDLNVYETAQLENFNAFVHFDRDEHDAAAKAYENILALPRSELPDGLIQSSMRNLATLYLQQEQWDDGLELYDRWMALPSVTPKSNDYYQLAMIYYQMERYEDALVPMEQAIAESEEPIENYYQMLYVLNFQTDNEEGVSSALETLNERWPKETWAKALEGAQLRQAADAAAAASATDGQAQAQSGPANLSREYLPLVTAAPIYPPPAAARGLEGYVVAKYTVATDGTTKDIEIVESSDPVFENASIESVEKYRYRPQVIDGTSVEVAGVTTRIVFELGEDIG